VALNKTIIETAVTYFTGHAVSILETKDRATKRAKLQSALDKLNEAGGSESNLDSVLRTQVEKAMRL
jgi:hypothetical protein